MQIAVRFWGNNAKGIPADWPAEVNENPVEDLAAGWVLMTKEEYLSYRSARLANYQQWESTYVPLSE